MPLTRFELVATPLPRECATPAPQRLISETPSSLLLRVLPLTNLTLSQLLFGRVPAPQRQMPQGCNRTSLIKKAGNRNRTYNLRFTKPLLYR